MNKIKKKIFLLPLLLLGLVLTGCSLEGKVGPQGEQGIPGEKGDKGEPGQNGISVVSIIKTSTSGLVDTYTITYSDGTTSTFTVTNGQDGIQGIQGNPGQDGHTPIITIGTNGHWFIDGVDSGVSAKGEKGDKGEPGQNGRDGQDAPHAGETFTVNYYLNGGSMPAGSPTKLTVTWGDTLNLPIPSYYGHIFDGWFTGNTVNDRQFYKFDAVFMNLDLYAHWHVGEYTLTLDLNGGTYGGPTSMNYSYGDSYSIPSTIDKSGYIFTHWSLGEEEFACTGRYNYENITIKANYEVSPYYTLNLNLNGGTYTGQTSFTLEYGENFTLPYEGVTNGEKVLLGWYDGSEKWDFTGTYKIKEDKWLAAKWGNLETYHFTIDTNGGTYTGLTSFDLTNKDIIEGKGLTNTPAKAGYSFLGFYDGNAKCFDNEGRLLMSLTANSTYALKAKYIGLDDEHIGEFMYMGKYPQTKVTDSVLIGALNAATDTDNDGYLEYGSKEYKKEEKRYSDPRFTYFEVEPILWRCYDDGMMICDKIIDQSYYYTSSSSRVVQGVDIYQNNYKYSTVRAFLNGYDGSSYRVSNYDNQGFIDLAFSDTEKAKIVTTEVDNSASSIGSASSSYACENTNDKIFLLSYSEATSATYGFKSNNSRKAKPTDYAIYKGVYYDSDYDSGIWWLRSPYSSYSNDARIVNFGGYIDYDYVSYSNYGVLPAFHIDR